MKVLDTLKLIFRILFFFTSILAPLLFLVGVIALLDQWGAHNRFLTNLEKYGKMTTATVTYIDDEYNRAGVKFFNTEGQECFGTLDFRYYSSDVIQTVQPDSKVRVLYIDKFISGNEKTALAEYYADVKSAPPVDADLLWMLGISWLIVAVQPHITFAGMADLEVIFAQSLIANRSTTG
ncbi:MAG: hypothetical protein ACM33V_09440 [Chloroflexota bacterium]|nr:hypothetical protein [Anaerolineales bacterium]